VRESEAGAIELIRSLLADASLRERLLAAQRERRGQWSAERMADGWAALYERLAVGAPAPAQQTAQAARTIGVPWT